MTVGDRMTKHPSTVFPGDTLAQAQDKLRAGGFRQLPVVENGRLLGILTDRDLRAHGRNIVAKVQSAMTSEVITVSPETPIEEAARLLLKQKIGALPVLERNELVGIISTSDILRAFVELMDAKDKEKQ
ncbi:MAG TPA: CBS domain-containing protein [Candidatus Eisenbacteria bacterium]|nr:CBS domain-containing protein [Candidatus Eisenbacteria bacterium]